MIKNLSKRETIILGLTIFVVLLFLLDRFVVGPSWDKLNVVHQELTQKELMLQREKDLYIRSHAILNDYDTEFKLFKESENDTNSTIKVLTDMARPLGIHIKDLQPMPPKKVKGKDVVVLRFTVEASLSSLARLIENLGKPPALFLIERMELTRYSADSLLIKGQFEVEKISF
jgi:hypothetical protein